MAQLEEIDPETHHFRLTDDCTYEDSDSIINKINNTNCFNILHINIRSCNKNLNKFLVYLSSMKVNFHALILTETWLKAESDWLDIQGYKAFHCTRENRKNGGGITTLIRSNIPFDPISNLTVNSDTFESLSVEINLNKKKHQIVGLYRPPSSSLLTFNETFFNIFTDNDKKSSIIIAGDVNIDLLSQNYSNQETRYFDELRSTIFYP